jgi:hypothetical protein
MKTKITIHRALSELKLIDAKIERQIDELIPAGIHQKGKLINNYIPENDFKSSAQSKFDAVNDLINRKNVIKSAIVAANGYTKVTVAGKEMTIADAINYKSVVKYKRNLAKMLRDRLNSAVSAMNKNNEAVEKNIQAILEATFGKENVKVGKDDVEAVRKPYLEANEFHLFDPLKATEKIETIEKEVAEFEAEVDAVLSEINAITFIEV